MFYNVTNIYTIGCSVLSSQEFIVLLKMHHIAAIADVRSVPYSKFAPQFNKETLKASLQNHDIHYITMNEEFGARRAEPEAYTGHRVDFNKTAQLPLFKQGITRIARGLEKGMSIALMCAEKDPLDCHRFLLVARNIEISLGIAAKHIHSDGSVEDKTAIEQRLLKMLKIQPSLFEAKEEECIATAYEIRGRVIGYRKDKA